MFNILPVSFRPAALSSSFHQIKIPDGGVALGFLKQTAVMSWAETLTDEGNSNRHRALLERGGEAWPHVDAILSQFGAAFLSVTALPASPHRQCF